MSEPTTDLTGRLREAAAKLTDGYNQISVAELRTLFPLLGVLAEQVAEAHDIDGPSFAAPAPCCCSYPEWPCPELVRWSPLIDALL